MKKDQRPSKYSYINIIKFAGFWQQLSSGKLIGTKLPSHPAVVLLPGQLKNPSRVDDVCNVLAAFMNIGASYITAYDAEGMFSSVKNGIYVRKNGICDV